MATSYTFRDFLARLERGSVAHIKPHYYQNQQLFVNRPDMLVRAVSELSYTKGAELLRAAKFSQEVPVEAHRAVLAQMLKHNTFQQREVLAQVQGGGASAAKERFADWKLALEVFLAAHTSYGNQTPMRVYQSALRLLGPHRQWTEAVKVLKLRQQVNDVTAPMLVDAAVCHATPEKCSEALRLLSIAHQVMPSYFSVCSGGDGEADGSGTKVDLALIGQRSLLMISEGSSEEPSPKLDSKGGKSNTNKSKRGSSASTRNDLLKEIKALEEEEQQALAAAAKVKNPFSLMPPERTSEGDADAEELGLVGSNTSAQRKKAEIDEAVRALYSGARLSEVTSFSTSRSSPLEEPRLTPKQQAAQEAQLLLSLVTVLSATPWEIAKKNPLLVGALEVVVNGGALPASALGRERVRLLKERQLILGGGEDTANTKKETAARTSALKLKEISVATTAGTSSPSSPSQLLSEIDEPLPIIEGFAVGYLPSSQGHQMQRDLLPLALSNVPWEDALILLFGAKAGGGRERGGGLANSSLPSYVVPHTSVSWTPALLATMLGKAPTADDAAKLSSLLPPSFMKHRDTAITMAKAQLHGSGGGRTAPANVNVGGYSCLISDAEHALDTLLSSSVATSATSSVSVATSGGSSAKGGSGGFEGGGGEDTSLTPSAIVDSSRPFPTDLISAIVLRLWAEGKVGRVVDAANLCMVTKSKLTRAALVAVLESAVKVSATLIEVERAVRAQRRENRSGNRDASSSFTEAERRRTQSAALSAVHWKTAVSWALSLQEGYQGQALGMADWNQQSETTFTTYGRRNVGNYHHGDGGLHASIMGYSSTLSESMAPSSSAFVRAAASSLEEAVMELERQQMFNEGAKVLGESVASRYDAMYSAKRGKGGASDEFASNSSSSSPSSGYSNNNNNNDVSFIPERGPPIDHRCLSLLIHLCALQRSPLGALRLVGYAAANADSSGGDTKMMSGPLTATTTSRSDEGKLAHAEEIKALLFCAQYGRPREAALVITTLEKRLAAALGVVVPTGKGVKAGSTHETSFVAASPSADHDAEQILNKKKLEAVEKSVKPLRSLYRALFPSTLPMSSSSPSFPPRGQARAKEQHTSSKSPPAPSSSETGSSDGHRHTRSATSTTTTVDTNSSPTRADSANKIGVNNTDSRGSTTNSTTSTSTDAFDLFDFGGMVRQRDLASANAKWASSIRHQSRRVPSEEENDDFIDDGDEEGEGIAGNARASSVRSL